MYSKRGREILKNSKPGKSSSNYIAVRFSLSIGVDYLYLPLFVSTHVRADNEKMKVRI